MDSTHFAFEWDCERCDASAPATAHSAVLVHPSRALADRRPLVDGARTTALRLDRDVINYTTTTTINTRIHTLSLSRLYLSHPLCDYAPR